MPPSVALLIWFVLLLGLLRLDPARVRGTSFAVWLAVISFLIVNSRLPSQWLGLVNVGSGYAQVLEEGNALDRTIYLGLIVASVAVLLRRSFSWSEFGTRNMALVAFLAFALLSVLWSDYVFVAFKRWFRDLAQYLTLLVLLTDPRPLDAIGTVYRRACYILIPLSIVLIKYFSHIGRQYEVWTGQPMYVGAATSKNVLGAFCMFSVLYFAWDTQERWADRRQPTTRRVLWVNAAFIAMALWLLDRAASATATLCLALGLLVLFLARSSLFRRRPALLLTAVPATFVIYATLSFGFDLDLNAWVASLVGRDPTLTGRTIIWETLLTFAPNAWLGAGYESFWMGPRLQQVWARAGTINQAHNGYLQTYLNLGAIGTFLLIVFLIVSYRNICRRFGTSLGRLGLTAWTVLLFYNFTEAAFITGSLWLLLLATSLRVSEPAAAAAPARERHATRPSPPVPSMPNVAAAPSRTAGAFVRGRTRAGIVSRAQPATSRFHTRRNRS